MEDHNPYAPSPATLQDSGRPPERLRHEVTFWREGLTLVMAHGASLPPRCVKCNEPAEQPVKARRVYWFSPWLYLLLVLNLILFAMVALLTRKKAIVAVGLCAVHRKQWRRRGALAKAAFLLGLVVVYVGMGSALGFWGVLIGMAMMVGSIVFGLAFGRPLSAARIDKTHVTLKGCGERFLDSLPVGEAQQLHDTAFVPAAARRQ